MPAKPKSPISLSVHRNTIAGRKKRELAREASTQVLRLMRQEDIRAYAFVGIGADGKAFTLWDTGSVMPLRVFPAVVREVLSDDIANSAVKDDWRAPLVNRS